MIAENGSFREYISGMNESSKTWCIFFSDVGHNSLLIAMARIASPSSPNASDNFFLRLSSLLIASRR